MKTQYKGTNNHKYEPGDRAVILQDTSGHQFPVNTVVRIIQISSLVNCEYAVAKADVKEAEYGDIWFVRCSDMTPLNISTS